MIKRNLQKELEEIFHKKVDLIEKSVFDYKFKTKNVREYKEKIRIFAGSSSKELAKKNSRVS